MNLEKIYQEQKLRKAAIFGSFTNSEEILEKGGEGSRGGKVIGHTKSGKPIYEQGSANSKQSEKNKQAPPSGKFIETASLEELHKIQHEQNLDIGNLPKEKMRQKIKKHFGY